MSLREDDALDILLRQALLPSPEVEPPAAVWRRIVNALPKTSPWSRWSRWTLWARGFANVFYLPILSSQSYCVESGGKCHPAPSIGWMGKQVLDLRLAF